MLLRPKTAFRVPGTVEWKDVLHIINPYYGYSPEAPHDFDTADRLFDLIASTIPLDSAEMINLAQRRTLDVKGLGVSANDYEKPGRGGRQELHGLFYFELDEYPHTLFASPYSRMSDQYTVLSERRNRSMLIEARRESLPHFKTIPTTYYGCAEILDVSVRVWQDDRQTLKTALSVFNQGLNILQLTNFR